MEYVTSFYWNEGSCGRLNQDSVSLQQAFCPNARFGWRKEAIFLLVADGIGGLAQGEWASGTVTEEMTRWFWEQALFVLERRGWQKLLEKSSVRSLRRIQEEMEWQEKNGQFYSGTTCTMAVVYRRRYLLVHIGDSRAYRIGKKECCLTTDHHQDGKLSRCIGDFGFCRPDIQTGRLRKKEILLLCTDGFCTGAPDGFWGQCFRGTNQKTAGEAQQSLQENLNRTGRFLLAHGAADNLTAAAVFLF